MFMGGFRSDMTGTKAMALEAACRAAGRAFVRFDYSGHGQSSGDFLDGTIGGWRDEAVAVLDEAAQRTPGPRRFLDGRVDHAAGGPRPSQAYRGAGRRSPRRPISPKT